MADSSGRGAGKASVAGPNPAGGAKPRGKRAQGGRVVESRYLQYEKKTSKKAPAADALKASGKVPEGGRKATLLQKSKDGSGTVKGDLQSTLLEGHGTAPPDLDLSAINDRSVVRRIPQLEKTVAKKTESTSFIAPRKKSPDPTEVMEMMESQTLLLSLLTLKMENSLAEFEEEAEKNLVLVCREAAALQEQAHGLRRRLLLCQRTRELAETLDTQMELLSPFEAVCERFKEQYRTFATALDTTRHELPLKSIHLEGDGHQLLDALQRDLETTHRLLGELGMGSAEENEQVLALLQELRDATSSKDLELQRYRWAPRAGGGGSRAGAGAASQASAGGERPAGVTVVPCGTHLSGA
ncbi:hypothetical protein GHT09_010513 [Marmota monax]|uniref:HAUS augmin-like complex subunit 8 n=1 Tax=Marmota monax TaxID=9995 RepID=A0A834UZR5_MARMO|nr:hypothetical protein GHT09_010513 [Marmota monax]